MRDLPLLTRGSPTLDADSLMRHPDDLREAVYSWLSEECAATDVSLIVALESWGYLLAAPVATHLGLALVVARRKVDRLSGNAVVRSYDMNSTQGHRIGIERASELTGNRIALVDDSVVSGGTLAAVAEIVSELGGEVTVALAITGDEQRRDEVEMAMKAPVRCYSWVR
jgi:adenine phosphoribosyltransferase